MVRIRIISPCTTAALNLEPGDEITVKTLTPELQALLNARRMDNQSVAEIVRGGSKPQTSTTPNRTPETATA